MLVTTQSGLKRLYLFIYLFIIITNDEEDMSWKGGGGTWEDLEEGETDINTVHICEA